MIKTCIDIWRLLCEKHRLYFVLVLIVSLVMMVTEMMGIGVIGLFVGFVYTGDESTLPGFFHRANEMTSDLLGVELVVAMGLLVLVIYIVRNIVYFLGVWMQVKFAQAVRYNISSRLFDYYVGQPFEYFLDKKAAGLVYEITGESNRFSGQGVHQILVLCNDFLVLGGLTLFLLYLEPTITVAVLLAVSVVGFLVHLPIKRVSKSQGRRMSQANQNMIQALQNLFTGIKTVKSFGAEGVFQRDFSSGSYDLSQSMTRLTSISFITRPVIEVLAVITLVVVLVRAFQSSMDLSTKVGTATIFILAVFRLLPTIPRIMTSLGSIGSIGHIVVDLKRKLRDPHEASDATPPKPAGRTFVWR